MIRTFLLFRRMIRQLHDAPLPVGEIQTRGAEFRIIYEPEGSLRARRAMAIHMGEPVPARQWLYEVSFYPVVGEPCYTQRGRTLAEALKRSIDAPFPAALR